MGFRQFFVSPTRTLFEAYGYLIIAPFDLLIFYALDEKQPGSIIAGLDYAETIQNSGFSLPTFRP